MPFGAAETERLRLEPWGAPDHTEALVELNADLEVTQYLGGPADRATSEETSARLARHWDDHGFGLWAVVEKASGRVAGFDGICHPLWHPAYADQVEVGWRLARWAWGKGYATEAARTALDHGWDELGLDEIIAFVDPDNARSLAVARRLGMSEADTTADPNTGRAMLVLAVRRP